MQAENIDTEPIQTPLPDGLPILGDDENVIGTATLFRTSVEYGVGYIPASYWEPADYSSTRSEDVAYYVCPDGSVLDPDSEDCYPNETAADEAIAERLQSAYEDGRD